jgi:hypothetical protein
MVTVDLLVSLLAMSSPYLMPTYYPNISCVVCIRSVAFDMP